MKNAATLLTLLMAAALAGCSYDHRDTSPGEQAGRAAYTVQKDAKKAAKEIQHELKSFGKDAKEGWKDARANDHSKPADPK